MAVHQPLGPRFETVVPIETAVPDIDAREAFRRVGRQFAAGVDWRAEALDWHARIGAIFSDRIRAQYAAEDQRFLASWSAQFKTGDAREADQFQAWLEHAVRAGTVEAQLALIESLGGPEWIKRYASYVRRNRERTEAIWAAVERYAETYEIEPDRVRITRPGDCDRPRRFADTGTFFWEER